YGAYIGGAAVLAAKAVRKISEVAWLDLGMPEALWIMEVERFGPLIIAIDSHGSNLYDQVKIEVEQNQKKIYEKLGI
ncbi:MAG: fumarate hydratase C-terminal domain-containing protein, partial [Candidatus Hodarchaeales archaeon]